MADSREPSCLRCKSYDVALRQAKAQNRRLVEELDWAEEQVRVLRRLVERLVREDQGRQDSS